MSQPLPESRPVAVVATQRVREAAAARAAHAGDAPVAHFLRGATVTADTGGGSLAVERGPDVIRLDPHWLSAVGLEHAAALLYLAAMAVVTTPPAQGRAGRAAR